ncbi:hypothetical protein ON010_g1537 [Phytophthora cinnamomi]|nr:hypothetical protein ON010_g1537 [Phytophthora cinnamomi]
MDLDETAWISIRPHSDADGLNCGALMEICSRQSPVRYLISNADDPAVKAFKSMMKDAIKEDEREIIRSLEKLLLDDTLAGLNV